MGDRLQLPKGISLPPAARQDEELSEGHGGQSLGSDSEDSWDDEEDGSLAGSEVGDGETAAAHPAR